MDSWQDVHLNLGEPSALRNGDILGDAFGDPFGRAAHLGALLGDTLGDIPGCVPLVDRGGVIGAGVCSSCDPGAVFELARAVGRVAVVAEGLLLAALAFEETTIAPPVGARTSLGQVESLTWRKPKPCRSVPSK